MLCRDGSHPMLIGRKDRQDVDEPETECRRRDEKGRGTRQALFIRDVGGTSDPGQRSAGPVVHRHRHRIGDSASFGKPFIDELEEIAGRFRAARHRSSGGWIRRNPECDSRQDRGHAIEALSNLLLDARSRGRLRGSESPELDDRSRDRRDQRQRETRHQQAARAHTSAAQPRL